MNIAVGIGRAVVENKQRLISCCILQFLIQSFFIPTLQVLGFFLGQIGLHFESGFWQIQGVPVFHGLLS